MARAIWKAVVSIGSAQVPVKLYSAVQDQKVHFRLLHDQSHTPVSQKLVHPDTGKEVPREEIRQGVEVDRGVFVILDEEDLVSVEPEESRTIEVERFVEPRTINDQWYDRPYYLGPDGDEEGYWSLVEAMEKDGREGVARWVMRKRRHIGSLRAERGRLMLITLRRAGEVIRSEDLPAPKGRDLDRRELTMARQLVSALESAFDPTKYTDEFRERVKDLVKRKARGEKVKTPARVEERPRERSLRDALEASLAGAGSGAGSGAGKGR